MKPLERRNAETLQPAGLLFDLDGVLVDSFESWYLLFSDLFRERFSRNLTRHEFLDRFWSRDLREIFAELNLDIDLDSFCFETFSRYLDQVIPAAGAGRILEALDRYPKAIITNTPAGCVSLILAKFGFQQYFATVITGSEVTRGKPDPEIVHQACQALSIRPEETVLIGDSTLDVRAGKAAGCKVIGIKVQADFTIQRLAGLLELIRP